MLLLWVVSSFSEFVWFCFCLGFGEGSRWIGLDWITDFSLNSFVCVSGYCFCCLSGVRYLELEYVKA